MFLTNNTTYMKYYILFGPPGAGKGTQATAMVEKYNLHHISTGALLRKEIAAGTELGLQAKALIENGCLVPDEVVEGMIESEFKTVTGVDGFLLDGFPRTLPQAEALDQILAKTGEENTALILVATSGDTGKAALEGYKNTDGWNTLVKRAMECDNSWKKSANDYIRLYNALIKG